MTTTERRTDGRWYQLPNCTEGSPIDEDAGEVGGDDQAGPAYAISWRRAVLLDGEPNWETLTLYHFTTVQDPDTHTNPRLGPDVETMVELIRHTGENDPGATEIESDYRYESPVSADPSGELPRDAALDKANANARQYTLDNLDLDPQILWWALPGVTVTNLHRRDVDSNPGIHLTRDQLESWAGRSLTDSEVVRLDDAIPNSSIPEAVGTIVASMNN